MKRTGTKETNPKFTKQDPSGMTIKKAKQKTKYDIVYKPIKILLK